jgi:hypothetical protein
VGLLLVVQQIAGDSMLMVYAVCAVSLRQRELPGGVLGRANATFSVLSGAALPIGALAAGWTAEAIGLAPVLWIGAIGGVLGSLILGVPAMLGIRSSTETGDG